MVSAYLPRGALRTANVDLFSSWMDEQTTNDPLFQKPSPAPAQPAPEPQPDLSQAISPPVRDTWASEPSQDMAAGAAPALLPPSPAPAATQPPPVESPPAVSPTRPAPGPSGVQGTPYTFGPASSQRFSPFDDVFRRYAGDLAGDPEFIATVAAGTKAESGWDPNAVGDNGHSKGIFQMHDQGAGAGMGDARLDPDAASAVMVPRYLAAYQQVKAQNPNLSGPELASLVAALAERPQGWDDPNSAARQGYARAYQQIAGGEVSAGPSGGPAEVAHPAVQQFTDWLGQQAGQVGNAAGSMAQGAQDAAGNAAQQFQDWTGSRAQEWTSTGQQAAQQFQDWLGQQQTSSSSTTEPTIRQEAAGQVPPAPEPPASLDTTALLQSAGERARVPEEPTIKAQGQAEAQATADAQKQQEQRQAILRARAGTPDWLQAPGTGQPVSFAPTADELAKGPEATIQELRDKLAREPGAVSAARASVEGLLDSANQLWRQGNTSWRETLARAVLLVNGDASPWLYDVASRQGLDAVWNAWKVHTVDPEIGVLKDVPVVGGLLTTPGVVGLAEQNPLQFAAPLVAPRLGAAATAAGAAGRVGQARVLRGAELAAQAADVATSGEFAPLTAAGYLGRGTQAARAAEAGAPDTARAGMVAGEPGGRILYHGTGSDFARPDVSKFDRDGLFGPGYYLTSSPDVAAGYGDTVYRNTPKIALLERDIAATEAEVVSLRSGPLSRVFPDAAERAARSEAGIAEMTRQLDALMGGAGPNVRPVEVPPGLNLLDAEAPLDPRLLEQARQGMLGAGRDASSVLGEPGTTNGDLWEWLRQSRTPEAINAMLRDAGYDGIRYQGGKRIPLVDEAGKPIEHEAVVIFPESLQKVSNALSGQPGGLLPGTGSVAPTIARGALRGAVAGAVQEQQQTGEITPQGVLGGAVLGAATGAAGRLRPGSARLTGTVARVVEGTPGTVPDPAAVRAAAADADKIIAERQAVAAGTVGRTPTNADADRVLNGLVMAREKITDRRARLQAVEKEVERLQGSPLTLDQRAWMRSRVYEGHSDVALATLERQVGPAWTNLGAKNLPLLDAFAEQMDNVDKAAAAGRHALDRIVDQDPGRIAGQAKLEQAQAALRMRERMDQLAQSGGDAATQQIAQRNLRAAQRDVQRAQQNYDAAEAAARQAQAQRAGTESARVAQERKFSGGARAQQEDAIREAWRQRLGQEQAQKMFDAADAMYAATRDLRQKLVKAGIFSQDMADFLGLHFPHYVPTKILDHVSDQALEHLPPGGRSFSVGSNGLKRLTEAGTEKARLAPTSSFVDAMFQGEQMAEKNTVVRTAAGWADVPGMDAFVRKMDSETVVPKGWKAMSYWDNGQKQRILVAEQLEPALALASPEIGGVLGVVFNALRLPLQLGATTLRPSFVAFNATNDLLWALYRFAVEAPNPVEALRGLTDIAHGYRAAFGGDPALVQRAREAGASIGPKSRYASSPELIVRELAGEHVWVRPVETAQGWQKLLSDVAGAATDIAGLGWSRPIGAIGSRVEKAPRLAAFARAERQAAPPLEAAFRSRTSTADFSAGGTAAKHLNQVTPFVNAATQFSTEFVNLTTAHPKASAVALSSIVAGTVLNELYNRAVAPEDYADVSDYVKDSGWVMLSDQAPEGQGKRGLVYVPLRGGFGAVVPLVRSAMRAMYGEDPRVWQSLYQVFQAQSPVEPDVAAFVPPVAQTYVEAASNYDLFRRRPIVPAGKASLPPSEQATERTSQTARLLGQATGESPIKIDYVARGISPGPAEALLGIADAIIRATDNALPEAPAQGEPGARDVPLVGGIAGRFLKTVGNERQNRAYEEADAIMAAKRPIVVDAVKQSRAYLNATPDRRDQLLRSTESELQNLAREMAGVLAQPKDTGLPARYIGVAANSAREREITTALSTPAKDRTVRQQLLAGQYNGMRNPLYKGAVATDTAENAAIRKTVRGAFP